MSGRYLTSCGGGLLGNSPIVLVVRAKFTISLGLKFFFVVPHGKMVKFRDVRNLLVSSYDDGDISDDEFCLLYDYHWSRDSYPYWNYERFNLESFDNAECWSQFRFHKREIYRLSDVLGIPETMKTYNRMSVDGIEALCVFLKRFAYPCRYADMIPFFGRAVPDYSIISNAVMDHIFSNYSHLLSDFDTPHLAREKLEEYCSAITAKGSPLQNCFGFIDGTVRPMCRPGENQRTVYNGHKKVHSLKFQSVALPNGLIGNMYGPLEGRRHDSFLLRMSDLLPKLQRHAFDTNGNALCVYGDPAYPLRIHLQSPFKSPILTPEESEFNTAMSKVRTAVEWLFGDITNWVVFVDFKRNLKLGLSPMGKVYLTCPLLANARTCCYGNLTSDYFMMEPPSLEEYFVRNIE